MSTAVYRLTVGQVRWAGSSAHGLTPTITPGSCVPVGGLLDRACSKFIKMVGEISVSHYRIEGPSLGVGFFFLFLFLLLADGSTQLLEAAPTPLRVSPSHLPGQ